MTTSLNQSTPNPTRADVTPVQASYPDLQGKTAVVTGAARGMGAVFVEELARRGVHAVGGDINGDDMVALADKINSGAEAGSGRIVGRRLDVTEPAEHDALLQTALDEYGRVDFWINNAGIFPQAEFTEIPPGRSAAPESLASTTWQCQLAASSASPSP